MDCREKKIRDLILDYVEEKLDSGTAAQVKNHLGDCLECRTIEREYRQSIMGLKAVFTGVAKQHIANDTLVRYVDNPESISRSEKESLELHIALCSSCKEKVEMLQRVAGELSTTSLDSSSDWSGRGIGRIIDIPRRRLALSLAAAAIVVLVAIYWSIIGVGRGPQILFTSAENVTWLYESTRGEQPLPEISESEDWIRIGIKFHAFFSEESYTIQLQTPKGDKLEECKIRQEDYDGTGVTMEIETSTLESGNYRLILISRKLADGQYSLRVAYPFKLLKE
jgi:hypothetical protein